MRPSAGFLPFLPLDLTDDSAAATLVNRSSTGEQEAQTFGKFCSKKYPLPWRIPTSPSMWIGYPTTISVISLLTTLANSSQQPSSSTPGCSKGREIPSSSFPCQPDPFGSVINPKINRHKRKALVRDEFFSPTPGQVPSPPGAVLVADHGRITRLHHDQILHPK